jgi:hypothetical protein
VGIFHKVESSSLPVLGSENSMSTGSDSLLKSDAMLPELEAYLFFNSKRHRSIFSQPKILHFDEIDDLKLTYANEY